MTIIDPSKNPRKRVKKSILIILILFILITYFAKILSDQNCQANKSQIGDQTTSYQRYFDIFCIINHFYHNFQIPPLKSQKKASQFSRIKDQIAKHIYMMKRLINQSKSFIYFELILMKDRVLAFKESLENLQARKNEALKLWHPEDHLQFMQGLVFGQKSSDAQYTVDFQNAGMLHVLVASGFNVALVAGVAAILVKNLSRGMQLGVILTTIWIYVAYLEFQPPLLRAAWMFSIIFLLKFWKIRTKRSRVLVFSVILMLVFQPALITSLSLWLSVMATLGILVFSQRLSLFWREDNKQQRMSAIFLEEATASLSAQALVFPLLVWFFHSVNLVGFVANPFLLPWVGTMTQLAGLEYLLTALDRFWPGRMLLWLVARMMGVVFELYFAAVHWWQRLAFLNFTPSAAQTRNYLWYWLIFLGGFLLLTRSKHQRKAFFFHEKV